MPIYFTENSSEHAADQEEKAQLLIIKFYNQNTSNVSEAFRTYRWMENLRKTPVKGMLCKLEEDVASGRGRCATDPATVTIATAEASENSSSAIVCGSSIARALDIPWATVRMTLHKIPKLYPLKIYFVRPLTCHYLHVSISPCIFWKGCK
ncbi:hypothetical protein HNY73_000079 [Argiope bruennichi]|uniref:Uncharacterized protein n=1 Tax=Argiope bruennichi TaxID=94029 RepID=A0A8T0FWY6_ARGBR|nr:hypothetical protein HNY73_000079 [Argiope bruennichi]